MLAVYPCLVLAFSLGYGGTDDLGTKIFKRAVYAFGVLMAGVVMCLILGSWFIFIPHFFMGMVSIYLGVKNPLPAAVEEIFVCLSLTAFLVAYPFA
jgi:membrane-associated protease RseP (regulator of RpoE activity)